MKNYKALITTEKQLQAEFNKPVVEITQSEINKYLEKIKSKYTYTTLRTKVALINILFKQSGNDAFVELKKEDMTSNEKGIITKKDLLNVIEMLDNEQDKFILMALFNGIAGKQAQDLLNLKRTDIDFKNKTINLPDRVIKMDDYFCEITKKAIEQKKYTLISLDFSKGTVIETYELANSPYIVKVRPYKRNNMGMDVLSYGGFRTRFGTICKFLDLDVTISSLEKSGIINRMIEENAGDTVRDIEKWLKNNKIKMERFLAFRLYKNAKDMLQ